MRAFAKRTTVNIQSVFHVTKTTDASFLEEDDHRTSANIIAYCNLNVPLRININIAYVVKKYNIFISDDGMS